MYRKGKIYKGVYLYHWSMILRLLSCAVPRRPSQAETGNFCKLFPISYPGSFH